jgi:hypothetical protein
MAPLLAATERDQAAIDQVVARYHLEIDFTTIPTLAEQHNRAWDSRTNRQGARCGTARDHDAAVSPEPDNGNRGAYPQTAVEAPRTRWSDQTVSPRPPPSDRLSDAALRNLRPAPQERQAQPDSVVI